MRYLAIVAILLAALAVACGSDSPTAPTPVPPSGLPAAVRIAMEQALSDEYRAETTYQGVINDLGAYPPFVNVLQAEQRHSSSIAGLFTNRGLTPPANGWTLALVPHYATIPAACTAAAAAERANIALYDGFLGLDLPADVRQVFENNRAASLFNHLPAFERCAR